MQRSGIPVETNSCECGLKGFVRSWIKEFLWKLLLYRKFLLQMQTKWIYVHLALPVWLWDMWGHFLQKRRENHFFIVPHWKGTLIKHKHNFMSKYMELKKETTSWILHGGCASGHIWHMTNIILTSRPICWLNIFGGKICNFFQWINFQFLLFWFAVRCNGPIHWWPNL